jgi:hypothetical protein
MKVWSKTALTLALAFQATGALSATSTVYFLEHYEKPSRCYYTTKTSFDKANEANSSHLLGTLTYKDGQLAAVDETIDSESGDWMMFDTYHLDEKGALTKLDRTLNTFYGDVTVQETFVFRNGRPNRTTITVRDLKTKKIVDQKKREIMPSAIPVRRSFPYPKQVVAKSYCEQTKR